MAEPSTENQSPPGRVGTTEKRLGLGDRAVVVRIEPLAPRAAFRVLGLVFKIAGPLLAPVISDGGVSIDGNRYSLKALLLVESARLALIGELVSKLDALDPDQLLELADLLIVNQCAIKLPGLDVWTPIVAPPGAPAAARGALIDALVPDVWTLIGMVKTAIEVNFSPTSAAASIAGSTSAAEATPKAGGI